MPAWPSLTRRKALSLLAVSAVGGILIPRASFAAENAALITDADVCVIIPEVTEGPYYFDPALLRADITEGRPGLPTKLRLQVVDALCQPMADARVDVWHCDATGVYSGYANQTDSVDTTGETFMRGTQMTAADGVAEFDTVYPGWYRGRTTHIHFKVFLDETNVLTGQIFFPEDVSTKVYSTVVPYSERGAERDTLNANDNIAQQAGEASVATVNEAADGYLVALIIGVDPAAVSSGGMGGGPGGPPPA
jgi:protocatechuate 3,4-dioxygenase beta subunit